MKLIILDFYLYNKLFSKNMIPIRIIKVSLLFQVDDGFAGITMWMNHRRRIEMKSLCCESTSHSVSESDLYTNYSVDGLSEVSTDETMWNNFILQQKLFTKLLINYEPPKNFLNV